MAVLAIVLVSALRVSTDGGWRVDRAAHRLALVRIADDLIERADVDLSLANGSLTGTEGGASWRLERTPFIVTEPADGEDADLFTKSPSLGSSKASADSTGQDGKSQSDGLSAMLSRDDQKGSDLSIKIGQDEGQDRKTLLGNQASTDLGAKPKLGLWLIKVTVSDASGQQVQLSTLRLEGGS